MAVIHTYTKTNGQKLSILVNPIGSAGLCPSATCFVIPIMSVNAADDAIAGIAACIVLMKRQK